MARTLTPVSLSKSLTIGSEKTWSWLTYTTTVGDSGPDRRRHETNARTATAANARANHFAMGVPFTTRIGRALSLPPIGKIVERSNAVRLRPNADGALTRNPIIVDADVLLAVEGHADGPARKLCAQCMPVLG